MFLSGIYFQLHTHKIIDYGKSSFKVSYSIHVKVLTRTTTEFLMLKLCKEATFLTLSIKQEAPVNAYFAVISVPRQSGRSNWSIEYW